MTGDLAKRFGKGLAWNYAGRAGEFGMRFLFVSLVVKGLGPDGFGVYSFAASVVVAGTLLGALGYEQALNNFIPAHRGEDASQAYLLRRFLALRLLIFAAMGLVGAAVAPLLTRWLGSVASAVVWALPYMFGMNIANLLAYFWVGRLEVRFVTMVRILTQVVNFGVAWWLIGRGYGPQAVLLLMGGTSGLAAVAYLVYSRKFFVGPSKPQPLGRIHRFAINLGVINGVNYLLGQQSDVALLGLLLRNSAELGLYNLAALLNLILSTALLIGFDGVSQTALAEMASRGAERVSGTWRALVKLTMLLAVPVLAFSLLHASRLVGLYGAGFAQAAPLLRAYLGFTLVARFLGGGTNTATLYAIRKEHLPLQIRSATGALNLVLAIALIPGLGAMGAVLATGIALVLTAAAETFMAMRQTGASYPLRFAAIVTASSVVAAAISYPLTRGGFQGLLLGALTFLAAFVAAFALWRPLEQADQDVLQRISPRVAGWAQRLTRG